MEYLTLHNGVQMPLVGFGTFTLGGETCKNAVAAAIESGYRMIDTAEAYGNEKEVGAGIRQSGIDRRELFLVTKVNFKSYENAEQSVMQSLANLQTDYIDLLLLHWPFANYYAAWRALEKLYAEGKVRAIGVSNFEPDQLLDLIAYNKIVPAVDQIETNLYCQRSTERSWMDQKQVAHMTYAPLGQGNRNEMFGEPAVLALAEKYGRTPAQILLRFLTQKRTGPEGTADRQAGNARTGGILADMVKGHPSHAPHHSPIRRRITCPSRALRRRPPSKGGACLRDEKAFHINVFQLQQLHFPVDAAAITGETSACSDDAVAGDHQGNGVVPHRAADGLGGHFCQSALARDPGGDLPVGHGLPVGNGEHDVADGLPERCGIVTKWRQKVRFSAGKVYIQPLFRVLQQQLLPLLRLRRQDVSVVLLPVEPQADDGPFVTGQGDVPQRGCILRCIDHGNDLPSSCIRP